MAHNPLLGNRISLISKKNIRYEGTLYSINEADATVALAEVRSYGTEGREKLDPNAAYVPPQDAVHPYLLFRGCDIKDLHVHERGTEESTPKPPPPPPDPAILSTQAPSEINAHRAPKPPPPPSSAVPQQLQQQPQPNVTPAAATTVDKAPPNDGETEIEKASATKTTRAVNDANSNGEYQGTKNRSRPTTPAKSHSSHNGTQSSNNEIRQKYDNRSDGPRYMNGYKNHSRSNSAHNKSPYNRRPRRHDNKIGTGASLLNRKARGAVEGGGPELTPGNDFDFESSLAQFKEKTTIASGSDPEDNDSSSAHAYSKDDFFDSISCDVLDKQNGIDNRLRGAAERSLNMDTFGAVSLGNGRRGGRRKGGGRRSWYRGGGQRG
eukprot:CAMPEP_0172495598 /NCGR_PEP_ID=MMETSP1066-20121228/72367_1 /TAXON_ID=671091 /ORGANISM="Coscinodiscus wailesii, Strain CCMP2513" /LENGTH=378 /DNA_ID=CAMNT_0013267371 /DNA_START=114 /DNA_END=1247 /DNA_ORIENTATION=+